VRSTYDTTITEILSARQTPSVKDDNVHYLVNWSRSNKMLINYTKTKEVILGNAKSNPLPSLLIEGKKKIERVSSFKLLGVHISDDFRWENHINAVCTKVLSRLYLLKQLKRAGVSSDDLLYFYTVVIRPVFEYACVVWTTISRHRSQIN